MPPTMPRRSLPANAMMLRVTLDACEAGRSKIEESSVARASIAIRPPLTVPDPRVQHRVEHIDHQVDYDHEKDHEQDHPLDDNEVPGADRIQQQIAYAGIVETDSTMVISPLRYAICKPTTVNVV